MDYLQFTINDVKHSCIAPMARETLNKALTRSKMIRDSSLL